MRDFFEREIVFVRQPGFRPGPRRLGRTGFILLKVTKGCSVLALLVSASLRGTAAELSTTTAQPSAQQAPDQPSAGKIPAVAPTISYTGGQLTIHALDSKLADVLAKVAALTGMQIDAPEGFNGEAMSMIQLGPGPARQVLASLLSDSNSDFLIQASDTDPEKVQSVLIMPRKKRGSEAADMNVAAPRSRSPYARVLATPGESEEAAANDSAVATQSNSAAAEASAVNPQTQSTQPQPSAELALSQRDQSSLTRPGALTPPAMNPQSINQQLQQMYQQRMQMVQQNRGQVTPSVQQ